MGRVHRVGVAFAALAMLAGFAPAAQKGEEALDGTWRYVRVADGVRHPGMVTLRNGGGINKVSFVYDGQLHIVEFAVRVEMTADGAVIRPSGPVRGIEPPGYDDYAADIFPCRWTRPTLTCTNTDEDGQSDDAEFVMTR